MPDEFLGKDFTKDLENRILYEKVDTLPGPNNEKVEGVFTFKMDFPSTKEFFDFVNKFGKWEGSGRERNWVGGMIFAKDSNIFKDREIVLDSIVYKDSMYDDRSVVVVIVRYHQALV